MSAPLEATPAASSPACVPDAGHHSPPSQPILGPYSSMSTSITPYFPPFSLLHRAAPGNSLARHPPAPALPARAALPAWLLVGRPPATSFSFTIWWAPSTLLSTIRPLAPGAQGMHSEGGSL